MCGISGFANFSYDLQVNIEKMKDRMLHRGPDAEGSYILEDHKLALGHRRLSIVDITETGSQPMWSHDERFVMVFNGEIYNHRALRKSLIDDESNNVSEVDFRGTSDTETILELFSSYGIEEALKLMKGMFAIALYDTKEEVLYLMRDRIGEKPLYYGYVGDAFVFASDIGSIAVLDGFTNKINPDVLDLYFINGYISAPYSIYEDIYKLPAGSLLKLEAPFSRNAGISIVQYYDLREVALNGQQNKFKGSFNEAVDELERLMKESIKDQMVADVPVGAFLSAGIDSSTTVSLMQSLNSDSVRTFTIGMEDPKYNEAVYAKEIAAHLGTKHTELYITEADAKAVIPQIPFIFGEPFADSSQIPTYLVSKMTREHVTVSLSGDGGDELFAGYNSYESTERIWNKLNKVPYFIRKPVSVIGSPFTNTNNIVRRTKVALLGARGPESVYNISREYDPGIEALALKRSNLKSINDTQPDDFLGEVHHDVMLMDMLMYHPDDILVKVDRTAMAVSLETRVPMLDRDVVAFAWSLPIEYLREGYTGKKILRELLYRYVPQNMMDRPKKGFSVPVKKWLLEDKDIRMWAESLLDPELIRSQGYLNEAVVTKMWRDFTINKLWRPQIWYVLMFQQWLMENKKDLA